jgi:phosphatidylglycerophosphate synthase
MRVTALDGAGLVDAAGTTSGGMATAGGVAGGEGDEEDEAAAGGSGGSASAFWQLKAADVDARARRETSRVGSGQFMGAREVYQRTKKVPDLFWNRCVCRPLAAVLVNAVKDSRITPNQITLASFAVGMASAVLLIALPGYPGLLLAVLVYQASYVLDCADGMLARWRGITSPAGHLLDFLMDELKAFAVLAAASVRLHFEHPDFPYLLVGLAGLVALASGIAPAPSASEASQSFLGRALRFVEGAAKFLIHYPSYIAYVALWGQLELYLLPYVAVNALYAARAFLGVAWRFGRA